MDNFIKNSKAIRTYCWIFLAIGILEIFILIYVTHSFIALIPGLITIIPAFFTLNKDNIKRGYFVSIWSFIKYNPISIALIAFILGDFYSSGLINRGSEMGSIIIVSFLPLGALSLVFGILLLIKVSKHNKMLIIKKETTKANSGEQS